MIDDIPSAVLDDCAQLVKANSIQGPLIFQSVFFLFYLYKICKPLENIKFYKIVQETK